MDKKQNWYFTFCGDHLHHNGYVKIYGTLSSTRKEMFKRYKDKWGFQYNSIEKAGIDKFNLYEVRND